MPAEQGSVRHDDAVADFAVMCDVDASHQEAVVSDQRDPVLFFRGSVDSHRFSNDVVIANDHLRIAAPVAEVLGFGPQDSARIDAVKLADFDAPRQRDVVFQAGSFADLHLGSHDAKGSDIDFVIDFRSRVNRRLIGYEWSHGSVFGNGERRDPSGTGQVMPFCVVAPEVGFRTAGL